MMVKPQIKKTPILKNKKWNSFSNQELLRSVSKMDQKQLLKKYKLERFGLDEEQYEKQRDEFGKNELDQNPFHSLYELGKAYFSPFNIILLVISVYNFLAYFTYVFGTEDERSIFSLVGAIVVLTMVVVSGTITFIQSYRGYFVTKKLKSIISNRVNIIRYKEYQSGKDYQFSRIDNRNFLKLIKIGKELPVTDLVPGDLIYLSSGDMIPADVRLVYSNDLFINQSSLTGESLPVEKHAQVDKISDNVLEIQNICYTGTSVIAGSALAIVVATGDDTYFSSIGEMLNQEKQPEGSFLAGVRHVTRVLLIFMLVMVPLIYFVFIARNHNNLGNPINDNPWFTGLFFAIALVVALTPEMLPLIITTNLSNGASKLTKEKVVVKKLDSIQSLGAIDVLATDKTGTLTNDKIELISYHTVDRKKNEDLLKMLFMNSYFQTGLKNPMDRAIVDYAKHKKVDFLENIDKKYTKVDEIPFDFNRRKLTIVFQEPNKQRYLVTKGSVEEVLQATTKVFYEGEIIDLTDDFRRRIIARYEKMNERGERVLGVAYKPVLRTHKRFTPKDETDLIFLGFANFLDSPKPSSAKMIKLLGKYGVDLKILTGDNEQVTRAICKMVGLKIKNLISGQELEDMTPYELARAVEKANVFVKLSPLQKVKVLDALKHNGHTVGYMGDGINDAPVLFQADVAISVNNAADIAKEASDIILLEKNLAVLERGIIEGRTVFGNILKYMKITVASQFGNALSMIIATAAFGNLFLAMSPIQTLFQNLIYDFSQLVIAFDYVDEEFLMKPRKWTTKDLIPFAVINGSVSSIFDITTYMVMGFGFGCFAAAGGNHSAAEITNATQTFQAGCFLVGLTTQASIFHVLRTEKIPVLQSRSPWFIYLVTLFILILAFTIVFVPVLANLLGMSSPSLVFLPIALGILTAYLVLAQLVKIIYIKIFHKWL